MSSMFVPSRKQIQLIQNGFGRESAEKVFLNLAQKFLAPIFQKMFSNTISPIFSDIPGHRIPVKCSLKNFDRENDYIFLVRGKDQHGRVGEFSEFSLAKKSN